MAGAATGGFLGLDFGVVSADTRVSCISVCHRSMLYNFCLSGGGRALMALQEGE